MPRPKTKQDLMLEGNKQFKKLWELIDSMSDEEKKTIFNFGENLDKKEAHWKRDKNIRDVLVHLYEWHELLLNWINANKNGEQKPFLPEPYSWKTYGDMNVEIWKRHQDTPYEKSKKMLNESHNKVIKLIETFSDEELFTKNHFAWVGGSTLGQYSISVTVAHYDWAMKKLKTHLKMLRAK